jgi:imidazoleglycerol-phosphate dehydratase
MTTHFFQSLAMEAKMSLHVKVLAGDNDHHKVESSFKALAKALDWATQIDERVAGEVPSTKGVL